MAISWRFRNCCMNAVDNRIGQQGGGWGEEAELRELVVSGGSEPVSAGTEYKETPMRIAEPREQSQFGGWPEEERRGAAACVPK